MSTLRNPKFSGIFAAIICGIYWGIWAALLIIAILMALIALCGFTLWLPCVYILLICIPLISVVGMGLLCVVPCCPICACLCCCSVCCCIPCCCCWFPIGLLLLFPIFFFQAFVIYYSKILIIETNLFFSQINLNNIPITPESWLSMFTQWQLNFKLTQSENKKMQLHSSQCFRDLKHQPLSKFIKMFKIYKYSFM